MFFKTCTTPQEVKAEYRKLAKEHHPDMGGNAETFKKVNKAYQAALKALDGTSHKVGDKTHRYTYNPETEARIMQVVSRLLALETGDDLKVVVVGTWIWVSGNTYPHKEAIKSVGKMRWHGKRKKWYWKPGGNNYYSSSKFKKFEELKDRYGSQTFQPGDRAGQLLAA